MIILTWNIKDLGSRIKHWELRNIVYSNKVDFLIILETKAELFSNITLRNISGGRLNHRVSLLSQGPVGGILMG